MLIGISQTAWQNLTTREQKIIRFVVERLRLGEPAIYVDTSDNRYFTFSDSRMRHKDFAVIGCFARSARSQTCSQT